MSMTRQVHDPRPDNKRGPVHLPRGCHLRDVRQGVESRLSAQRDPSSWENLTTVFPVQKKIGGKTKEVW